MLDNVAKVAEGIFEAQQSSKKRAAGVRERGENSAVEVWKGYPQIKEICVFQPVPRISDLKIPQLPPKSTEVKEMDWKRSQSTGVHRKCEKVKVRDFLYFSFLFVRSLSSGIPASMSQP